MKFLRFEYVDVSMSMWKELIYSSILIFVLTQARNVLESKQLSTGRSFLKRYVI